MKKTGKTPQSIRIGELVARSLHTRSIYKKKKKKEIFFIPGTNKKHFFKDTIYYSTPKHQRPRNNLMKIRKISTLKTTKVTQK